MSLPDDGTFPRTTGGMTSVPTEEQGGAIFNVKSEIPAASTEMPAPSNDSPMFTSTPPTGIKNTRNESNDNIKDETLDLEEPKIKRVKLEDEISEKDESVNIDSESDKSFEDDKFIETAEYVNSDDRAEKEQEYDNHNESKHYNDYDNRYQNFDKNNQNHHGFENQNNNKLHNNQSYESYNESRSLSYNHLKEPAALVSNSHKNYNSYPATSPSKPAKPSPPTNRLVIIYDKPRYYHMIMQLSELRNQPNEIVHILELSSISSLLTDPTLSTTKFHHLNICIEYNNESQSNLGKFITFIEQNDVKFQTFDDISYHIHFAPDKKWNTDYTEQEKSEYMRFLEVLNKMCGDKIHQCSIINKYDMDTVYITDQNDLSKLGQEIQDDFGYWKNLKILDYGESSIRFLPGVKFPDSLQVLNIGGGYALETLTGFKMPLNLTTLLASQGSINTIDNITFPPTLERLELADNKIYFLNYIDFPSNLLHLDLSQNRIESLRGVNFPPNLQSLNLGFNPIESLKGCKFPDNLKYLDISNIPNDSMTGVKFPDLLIVLNLQASMTNTRGLKLPLHLKKLILCDNGVNSINPLKLPNSIEVLYLNNNNVKTLNKVQFPSSLKELYLGDNLITTLKNVQFPSSLEVLDIDMDPDYDEHEKHITTLKDVIFPPNLRVLKLGYHSIKSIESFEFPYSLNSLSLAYNELKTLRNVRLGGGLKYLDLSGNQELLNIDHLAIPESVGELRVPPELVDNLPGYLVERVNKKRVIVKKSMKY